jgi:excinuclease UvrABC nuclease subunit
MTALQAYRKKQLRQLPGQTGVYVLCDLNEVPIYVGQSTDGIRARVLRHLTSARSDVIANRMLDVWEVAFVWAWPIEDKLQIDHLEQYLYHRFNRKSKLCLARDSG